MAALANVLSKFSRLVLLPRLAVGGSRQESTASNSKESPAKVAPLEHENGENLPVWSCNEWDPLKEIIVGRAEGQRVPFLNPDMKAKTGPDAWKFMLAEGGKPHDPSIVNAAAKEVEEFCRVLEGEGVVVKRPEPVRWDELGAFKTPYFEEGGYMNACPRDGLLVIEDEIIECPLAWRSRVFEFIAYKKIFNEYFRQGSRWVSSPRPAMADDLFVQDFPYEDKELREKMVYEGQFILTEAEIALDGADCMKFGRDIVVTLSHATNRSGVEWLRRHLKPRGIRVHSLIFKGTQNCHADATFMPLRPGLLMVNPVRPCLKVNDEPMGWEFFSKKGWDVVSVPEPTTIGNMYYVSKWVHMNVLSIDERRVFVQKGEEPLKRLFIKYGVQPIEVDMRAAYHLGGAFHCWTLDTKRIGRMQNYF